MLIQNGSDKFFCSDFDLASPADRNTLADILTDLERDVESKLLRDGRVVMWDTTEDEFRLIRAVCDVSITEMAEMASIFADDLDMTPMPQGILFERLDGVAIVKLEDGTELTGESKAMLWTNGRDARDLKVGYLLRFAELQGFQIVP